MTGGVSQGGLSARTNESGELNIGARIQGPGPAKYALPTTIGRNSVDLTKRQSPAFTFGSRAWSYKTDSPGPAYSIDSQLSHRGRESRPSYSFGSRIISPVRKDQSPGPGAYNTDHAPLWEKKAPQYSMSPRTNPRRIDNGPPPNSYKLPSTIGAHVPNMTGGPAASIYGRSEKHGFAEDLAKTPGPANYAVYSPNTYKKRSPEYSIKGRNWNPGPKNTVPGPGAYNPQNVYAHLEQSPRHVIGVRHSDFKMPTITQADVSD